MSRIPNSAIPHATAKDAALKTEAESGERSAFGQLTDKVREYPKTAAAGAAVVVGLATAAAIPAIRGRGRTTKSKSSTSKRK